ncbi:MAG: biotin--[acetyl-CoA-carboxylase] ligase [Archaeoglobaceae archaeon]|nr:biotin--[acetyl-CoA-carboxylase] ligase [Archaeoglobaceae archaeon]MCX8152723.1 biotin--[acetyl-CoA-carboxylase] ligase [Archaeoglobaceae archaeon]MDW8013430.1 biotin--[acetyl-CoA-carboxylase] ligase [Archaeoglobaceae archaeon]
MQRISIRVKKIDYIIYKEIKKGASGEDVARKIEKSRVSVWKRIKKMREFVEIEAKKGYGYRIIHEKDPNPYAIAEAAFDFLGTEEVFYFRSTDSTNERAKKFSKPNILFFAEKQTEGRGRWGRRWESDLGGLYFSFTLKPHFEELQKITIVSGLAVAEAIMDLGLRAELKWPNDVLIDGKKVCGILCELSGTYEEPIVIVGVGINVRNKFENATSLCDYKVCSLNLVFKKFCESFQRISNLSWREIILRYKNFCKTSGKFVRVLTPHGVVEGFAEIDDDGALLVNGRKILAGDCLHLR